MHAGWHMLMRICGQFALLPCALANGWCVLVHWIFAYGNQVHAAMQLSVSHGKRPAPISSCLPKALNNFKVLGSDKYFFKQVQSLLKAAVLKVSSRTLL